MIANKLLCFTHNKINAAIRYDCATMWALRNTTDERILRLRSGNCLRFALLKRGMYRERVIRKIRSTFTFVKHFHELDSFCADFGCSITDVIIIDNICALASHYVTSWKDVQQFYNFDVQIPVRLAPKLTNKHIYLPSFSQREFFVSYQFQVNLTAQVCSHSVYAGIQTLVALWKMSQSAAENGNFLKEVNDVFDFLNVRTARDKTNKPLKSNTKTLGTMTLFH